MQKSNITNQFLRIKIGNGVEEEIRGFEFGKNEDGEVYINKFAISNISCGEKFIYIEMSSDGDTFRAEYLRFDENGMGEYHRIRRELGIEKEKIS